MILQCLNAIYVSLCVCTRVRALRGVESSVTPWFSETNSFTKTWDFLTGQVGMPASPRDLLVTMSYALGLQACIPTAMVLGLEVSSLCLCAQHSPP